MRYFRRKDNFLPRQSAGGLVLYVLENEDKIVLNNSSTLLWQLSDGVTEFQEICNYAKQKFKLEETTLIAQIKQGLEKLVTLGVVEVLKTPKRALPIVKIGFCNMWSSFNPHDNYFLTGLSNHFTVFVNNLKKEKADIVFFGEFPPQDKAEIVQTQINRRDSIKIGVYSDPENVNENDFDIAITTFETDVVNSIYIPTWAMFFEWDLEKESKKNKFSIPVEFLPGIKSFNPAFLGEALINSLQKIQLQNHQEVQPPNEVLHPRKVSPRTKIKKGKLTIGMATYDDYDGAYFTLQSIRLHHPEVLDKLSFIIIDNNPKGEAGKSLKELELWVKNYKYIPFEEYNGTAVRDLIFRMADTEYVMSLDSHVLLAPNSLNRLINWIDDHPDCMDLLQGPIIYDDLNSYATSMSEEWRFGLYGIWHTDKRGAHHDMPPFEIGMHGLGLFACRKEAWLGLNPRFRGFGSEEGYLHEKYKQNNRKTICLPFLRWLHRFSRPKGIQYPINYKDRIRNYFIGFKELDWDTTPITYFKELIGEEKYAVIYHEITLELQSPFFYFDAIYFIGSNSKWKTFQDIFKKLHVSRLVRLHIYEESINYEKTRAKIVDKSIQYGFENVCIIDDRAKLTDEVILRLEELIKTIRLQAWKSLYIGNKVDGGVEGKVFDTAYVANYKRPEKSYVSAHNLMHNYELSASLSLQKQLIGETVGSDKALQVQL